MIGSCSYTVREAVWYPVEADSWILLIVGGHLNCGELFHGAKRPCASKLWSAVVSLLKNMNAIKPMLPAALFPLVSLSIMDCG